MAAWSNILLIASGFDMCEESIFNENQMCTFKTGQYYELVFVLVYNLGEAHQMICSTQCFIVLYNI